MARTTPPTETAREVECDYCEDQRFVMTARREVAPGSYVRSNPVPCPRCIPLPIRAGLAGVDKRFRDVRLDTLVERPGNQQALAMARSWDGTRSLVLASRAMPGDSLYGTGKTTIACAMLIERIAVGLPARFTTAQDYLERMKMLFDSESDSAQQYAERVASEPLLCLDDLGKAQDTDWSRSQLFRLIDARYRAQRPTIVTTNAGFPEIEQRFGGALLDRLNEFGWVLVGGESFRGA